MDWNRLFIYEPDTGRLINRIHRNSRSKKGWYAGYVSSSGYFVTRVYGRLYHAHRIVWELHNGPIPGGLEIDHINRVRTDNRIENLRLASRRDQSRNLSQRLSKSRVTGVVFNKKDRRWQAQIGVDGKHVYLGQFTTKEKAIAARQNAERRFGFRRLQ